MTDLLLKKLDRVWHWPPADKECRSVVFDWAEDLEDTYKALAQSNRPLHTCVQAGGNMGVWPWLLSHKFEHVYTFEPDPVCFRYLCQNLENSPNVYKFQAALGCYHQLVQLVPIHENLGAQYLHPSAPGHIPTFTIDDLALESCGLIYLDIEGFEFRALQGGYQTIKKHRPVIVVEDKGLSDQYGTKQGYIEEWLRSHFGYSVFSRPHRDVILVPSK